MTIEATAEYLKTEWPRIGEDLQAGRYRPQPVRRVQIPKAGGEVKRAVADRALSTFKERIRQITRQTCGRSLSEVTEELRCYLSGWKAYFQLAQTPQVFRELDEWLRHRLRALQLKHWRRGTTMFRELRKLGASRDQAARVAGNSRRWWHNSRMELNRLMPIAYFARLGVPRLS